MALLKSATAKATLAAGNYWKITRNDFNGMTTKTRVELSLFVNESARMSGAALIDYETFEFDGELDRDTCYDMIKSTDAFSDAEDV